MNVKVIYRERGRDFYTDVPHTHESEFELIHVLSGKGRVFVGERVLPFSGEAVFLLDAAVLHYVSPDADTPYVRTKLLIDKTLTVGAVAPLLEGGYLYRVPSPALSAKADRALAALDGLLAQKAPSLEVLSRVFELLHLCTAQMQGEREEAGGTVADAVGYIHEQLESGVSLSDVADALHVNKHYLCRLFKAEMGMTVGAYINTVLFDGDFWTQEPTSHYGGDYYRFTTRVRFALSLGQRLTYEFPEEWNHLGEAAELFYDFSANELSIISAVPNKRITLADILSLGVGARWKF